MKKSTTVALVGGLSMCLLSTANAASNFTDLGSFSPSSLGTDTLGGLSVPVGSSDSTSSLFETSDLGYFDGADTTSGDGSSSVSDDTSSSSSSSTSTWALLGLGILGLDLLFQDLGGGSDGSSITSGSSDGGGIPVHKPTTGSGGGNEGGTGPANGGSGGGSHSGGSGTGFTGGSTGGSTGSSTSGSGGNRGPGGSSNGDGPGGKPTSAVPAPAAALAFGLGALSRRRNRKGN